MNEFADIVVVIYPTRFLEGEDISNNFLFNADRYFVLRILSTIVTYIQHFQVDAPTYL